MTVSDDQRPDPLARLCAELPLPDALDAIEGHLPEAATIEAFVWDYQRRTVTGIRSGRSITREELDAVMAGDGHVRPLEVHGEHLGLLVVDGPTVAPEVVDRLAGILALAFRASEPVSDTIAVRRRTRPMSLPAEMQWRVLPPSQFAGRGIRISAAVEPAYDTGGDVFDYAVSGNRLFVAVLDARGHGLRAATTAAVATSAMRRSRRNGDGLVEMAREMHTSIGALGDEGEFVSTILLELSLDTWEGHWLSAGHLPPLVVTDRVVSLDVHPTLPLGMVVNGQSSEPRLQEVTLAEDETLVLFSDGIIENAAENDGSALGEQRFHRVLLDRLATDDGVGHVARAVVEDLLVITGPSIRDDATLLILERCPTDRSIEEI